MNCSIFVIFITLFNGTTVAVAGCLGESACPADKPYCTDVGCMFECPDVMYKNGSNCVPDCGEGYVQGDRICTESCRKGQYILETGKVTMNGLYNEKTCLNYCPQTASGHQIYVVNMSCVETCPLHLKFIAGNVCLQECPYYLTFKLNVTLNGINYHKCVDRCDRLSENGFCTNKCSNGKVTLNSTCLSNCPVSHPLLVGNKACVKQCSNEILLSNVTNCLCPEQTPFIQNYTCVPFCNETFKYVTVIDKRSYCTDTCSVDRYMLNETCVEMCPDKTYTFQNVCLEACPDGSMFVLNKSKGVECNSRNHCKSVRLSYECTERCPDKMYSLNYTCVHVCPSDYYIFNKTCFQRCAELLVSRDVKLIYKSWEYKLYEYYPWVTTMLTHIGKECITNCSRDEVLYNNTCLSQCPLSHRFVTDGVCHQEECSTQYYYNSTTYIICTSQCDELDLVYLNMCVTACPSNYVVFNGSCTIDCPADNYFETNITVTRGCDHICSANQFRQYKACLDKCPSNYYYLNNTCVQYCPLTLLNHNGTCVNTCPPTSPYLHDWDFVHVHMWDMLRDEQTFRYIDDKVNNKCVSNCGNDYFYNNVNMTCDKECKMPNGYIVNNTCVDSCPKNTYQNNINDNAYQLKTTEGVKCVDSCPTNYVVYNETCIDKCLNGQYDLNGICVIKCPPEQPHILKGQQPKCIRYCSDKDLLQDGKCISHYKCNMSITVVYDGQCLDNCPGDFVLVNVLCVHIRTFVILLVVVSTLMITTCVCSWKSLWKYFMILKIFFKSGDTIRPESNTKTATKGDYVEMKYIATTEAEDMDEDLSVDEETSLL